MDDDKSLINVDAKASLVNVDLGDSIEIKADLTPIIKATPKGFKYLSFLLFGKKEAGNERHIRLLKAQTDIDKKGILEGKLVFDPKDGTLLPTSQGLKQQIVGAIQDEEIQNLIACSIKAAENIKENEIEKEPSQDFINRWRNEVKQIHSEELQNIWGRLMAEEINNPDSVSLRTLDVIKNISKSEAESFVSCLKYMVHGGGLLYLKKPSSEQSLIPVNILINMRDAGWILGLNDKDLVWGHWQEVKLKDHSVYAMTIMNYVFYISKEFVNIRPYSKIFALSRAAQDMYAILRWDESNQLKEVEAENIVSCIKDDIQGFGAHSIYLGYMKDGEIITIKEFILNSLENV